VKGLAMGTMNDSIQSFSLVTNDSCPLQATSQIHILNPLRTAHMFAGLSLSSGPL
jgi:hypothetical protein